MQDILGRPIVVNDLVLTIGFGTSSMNTLTRVIKVNPTTISVEVEDQHAKWRFARGYAKTDESKRIMKRKSYQCVVVTQQMADNYKNFPEFFI